MSLEIEVKAWVDEPKEIESALRRFYGDPRPVLKEDIYYTADGRFPRLERIRLRHSGEDWILTFKDKNLEGETEINREYETMIGSFEVLDELLKRFGCRYLVDKKKRGLLFQWGVLTIELVEVDGLGTFLEVERVGEQDELEIKEARDAVLGVIDRVGLDRGRIELRDYTQMLLAKSS